MWHFTVFVLSSVWWLGACDSGCEQPKKSQETLEKSQRTPRVVSLAPSTTEALFALGLHKQIVGVSRYCDYPPAVKDFPKVGGFNDPSLEGILALNPTLVVGARAPNNRGVVKMLAAQGIDLFFPKIEDIDDIYFLLRGLGARLSRHDEAEMVIRGIEQDFADLEHVYTERDPAKVLVLFSDHPFYAAGPRSFVNDLIEKAQAKNVIEKGPAYPTLGLESIVALEPEVVIFAMMESGKDKYEVTHGEVLHGIPALQNSKIVTLRDMRLIRPGPRIGEAARILAKTIYEDIED